MVFEFKFPDVGEGIHEGEIVNWIVDEGDHVDEDEDIVEVMTDKATVQISAPVAGTIQTIVYDEGETVTVGEPFVLINPDEEPTLQDEETLKRSEEEAPTPDPAPRTEAPAPRPAGNGEAQGVIQTRTPEGILAPPSVRIEARKRGIDIAKVQGSGPAGRILMEDLDQATSTAPKPTSRGAEMDRFSFDVPSVDRDDVLRIEPLEAPAGSTRQTAHRSTTLQPHFTLAIRIQADALDQALGQAQVQGEERAIEPLAAVVKALAQALAKHPRLNALVDEDTDELVHREEVNVQVAWPTEEGAQLRTVAGAHHRGLREIQDVLEGGGEDAVPTVTVSIFHDEDAFVSTPVLVHPQVTGVVVGSLDEVPVLKEGQARVGHELTLSFSFDHRWVDGYDGALLAEDVRGLLAKPEAMLLG